MPGATRLDLNPQRLTPEQKALLYDVQEMFPIIDQADCIALCNGCKWNRELVNTTLAEDPNSFVNTSWKEIDRSSKRKKPKEGDNMKLTTDKQDNKKKKQFNRRGKKQWQNKRNGGKGNGKGKDRKTGKDARGKRNERDSSNSGKHLIQRTSAVTNTSAPAGGSSWAAMARAPKVTRQPRPPPPQTQSTNHRTHSPQRDASSKSGKENEQVATSTPDLLVGAPPGIMANSVWTTVQQEEPDQDEPDHHHTKTGYVDFFDPEQLVETSHLTDPDKGTLYAEPRPKKFLTAKTETLNMKPPIPASLIQSDPSSQYSSPFDALVETERPAGGVEFRMGGDNPEFSRPGGFEVPSARFQFADVGPHQTGGGTATNATQDSRSRPMSDISSAVGTGMPPFQSSKPSGGGVTMPANLHIPDPKRSEYLRLPPELEDHRGNAVYQFGVDFSEERKMQTEHQPPPSHLPPHLRSDPTQARIEYGSRQPSSAYKRLSSATSVNRKPRDLNLSSRQVDSRFQKLEQLPEKIFEDIMGAKRETHVPRPPPPHRMEIQFEERKSNQLEIEETRNQNRITPMHIVPSRPQHRVDLVRDVPFDKAIPAEIGNAPSQTTFFSEANHEPRVYNIDDKPPQSVEPMYQPQQSHFISAQNARPSGVYKSKPSFSTGFKDSAYLHQQQQQQQSQPQQGYGILESHSAIQTRSFDEAPANSPTPSDPLYGQHHATLVNANTQAEYKQSHHYTTAPSTNYLHYATPTTYYQVQPMQAQAYPTSTHWPHTTLRTNTYPAHRPGTVGHPTYPAPVVSNVAYAQYTPFHAPVR